MRLAACCAFLAAFVLLATTAGATARKKQQHVAHQPQIICGQTGCFEVPPGCGYEMRRVGRGGVTAVVICNKK